MKSKLLGLRMKKKWSRQEAACLAVLLLFGVLAPEISHSGPATDYAYAEQLDMTRRRFSNCNEEADLQGLRIDTLESIPKQIRALLIAHHVSLKNLKVSVPIRLPIGTSGLTDRTTYFASNNSVACSIDFDDDGGLDVDCLPKYPGICPSEKTRYKIFNRQF